jgi:hypothetical protein
MKAQFKVGQKVTMTDDALDNYGEEYRGIVFIVKSKATKYMPSKEFYTKGMPEGFHPGYDESVKGIGLYDLVISDDGDDFGNSLYDWELKAV